MNMPATNDHPTPLPTTFMELSALRPMRLISDDQDYDRALGLLDRLLALREPTQDQVAFMSTLATLIAGYEELMKPPEEGSPTELLQRLCTENHLNASALGRLLGNRSLGSKLLRGERSLSKRHIRILCRHFGVSAEQFL